MRAVPRCLVAALALTLAACGRTDEAPAATAGSEQILVDADGREVRLAVPAERVVSLVPSATLTLEAIGARAALVARTDFDTASWAAGIPTVGGGIEPSIESIVAARPDLVIRFGGPQDVRTPARLDDLGIPHLAIRPDDVDGVLAAIRMLGRITGREQAADSLVGRIRAELDAVRDAAADAPAVRVAYVLGGDPPWVAGPGTYIDELIGLAGGVNVFSDLGSLYAAISPEEFVARDIDVILIPRGGTFDRAAARGIQVIEVNSDFEIPGPGVADAAHDIARILRGGGP